MATTITAGDLSNPAIISSDTTGAVVIQTGAAGAKVNALTISAAGVVKPLDSAWPAFSVYRNSAQTISTTFATVAGDVEQYDTANAVSAGVFTAPVSGYYQFNGFCANSTTSCIMNQRFLRNGTESYYGMYISGNVNSVSMSALILLSAGDTVAYQVTQATSQSIATGLTGNYFQGALVRAA